LPANPRRELSWAAVAIDAAANPSWLTPWSTRQQALPRPTLQNNIIASGAKTEIDDE